MTAADWLGEYRRGSQQGHTPVSSNIPPLYGQLNFWIVTRMSCVQCMVVVHLLKGPSTFMNILHFTVFYVRKVFGYGKFFEEITAVGCFVLLQRNMKRSTSKNCLNQRCCLGSRERDWLREDPNRGCVFVYGSDHGSSVPDLHVVLCTVDTMTSEICSCEGMESLYIQLNGDLVR